MPKVRVLATWENAGKPKRTWTGRTDKVRCNQLAALWHYPLKWVLRRNQHAASQVFVLPAAVWFFSKDLLWGRECQARQRARGEPKWDLCIDSWRNINSGGGKPKCSPVSDRERFDDERQVNEHRFKKKDRVCINGINGYVVRVTKKNILRSWGERIQDAAWHREDEERVRGARASIRWGGRWIRAALVCMGEYDARVLDWG